MKCNYCQYEWDPRTESPVACPSCKNRLDRPRRIVGLQIGGTVGPMDSVGMYVPMPIHPGIGVKVQLDPQFDKELNEIASNIPSNHPKAEQMKMLIDEVLQEKDKGKKLQKIHTIVMIGAGITKIAESIAKISHLLGF